MEAGNVNIALEGGQTRDNNEVQQPAPRRTIRTVNQEESDATMERLQNAYPDFNFDFEIRGPLLNNLPKFHGLGGENPYSHLTTLQMHCRTMKPRTISVEDCMWKIFHLTLEGRARTWFTNLPRFADDAYSSWKNLRRAFLDQYFPTTKIAAAKKEIAAARQDITESFFDFWSRFQDMLAQCPNHQYTRKSLVEYFVHGLSQQDLNMLNAAANGSISNKTDEEAWELIRTIALDRQHVSGRDAQPIKAIGTAESDPLLEKIVADLDKLAAKVKQISSFQQHSPQAAPQAAFVAPQSLAMVAPSCQVCTSPMHQSQNCPFQYEEVSAVYQQRPGQFQRREQFAPQFNQGYSWGGGNQVRAPFSQNFQQGGASSSQNLQQKPPTTTLVPIEQGSSFSSKDNETQAMFKTIQETNMTLAKSVSSGFGEIRGEMGHMSNNITTLFKEVELIKTKHDNLNEFVTKVSNSINDHQAQSSGGMPSNTVINPKALNAINLRSGKELPDPHSNRDDPKVQVVEEPEDEPETEHFSRQAKERTPKSPSTQSQTSQDTALPPPTLKDQGKEVCIKDLPFPASYLKSRKQNDEKQDKEILELFSKLEVNVPLLELIKKVPKYAKFLKDLCTNKRKFRPNERVQVSSNVSALFKPQLPIKC